ncbi:Bcr/CflA family multidrug efflux MFS transporter [Chitinibacter bivalviorum]|uniref:Bcr/CflA family efflux transporter n=1 Tax=Chitinibacter bivalviorum TaxID=2739434 RepID=A0A7H9BKI5_9NEIS|nr:Bcr/CflA family multidrug efflux MFS transporter [Chitinibacter bivalviorum]QLG89083.1 Bcr/CflA family multidrug efflux MFS transporter [Chitinibacter bivalviorum]
MNTSKSISATTPHNRFAGWILLLAALTALGPLSIDMYLPGVPAIASSLHADDGTVQLTLASYFIGLAVGQILYGPLSDHFGRKPPLLIGLGVYLLASIGCALASSIEALIALRFVQALGGCAGMVIARAVVRDRCEPRMAAQVFSSLVLVMGIAPILAPLLGSWVVSVLSWRAIFALLALVALISLIAMHYLLPESRPAKVGERFHIGDTLRAYRELMRDRRFMGYAISGGLAVAGLFAYITGSPIVMMKVYGLTPTQYSLTFGSIAACYIVASQFNARFLKTNSIDQLLNRAVTVLAIASSILLLASLWTHPPFWLLVGCIYLYLIALGFTASNATAGALAHHGEQAGLASALMGTMQFSIATIAGVMMGFWHDGSSLPLATTLAFCGVGAFLAYRFIAIKLDGGI